MKKRNILLTILLLLAILIANNNNVLAETPSYIESPWIYQIEGNAATIIAYTGNSSKCYVPWELAGKEVKRVEKLDNDSVKELYVPNNSININEEVANAVDIYGYDLVDDNITVANLYGDNFTVPLTPAPQENDGHTTEHPDYSKENNNSSNVEELEDNNFSKNNTSVINNDSYMDDNVFEEKEDFLFEEREDDPFKEEIEPFKDEIIDSFKDDTDSNTVNSIKEVDGTKIIIACGVAVVIVFGIVVILKKKKRPIK